MSPSVPTLRFLRGSTIAVELPLGIAVSIQRVVVDAPIGELQECSFAVDSPEPGVKYQIRIGDIFADASRDEPPRGSPGQGRTFPGSVQWESAKYFESARGETVASLFSQGDSDQEWVPRAELTLRVVPTKLGEERYEAMYQSLSRLSLSFVHDLISKSSRFSSIAGGGVSAAVHSPQAQLRLIETTWVALVGAFADIERAPVTVLHRTLGQRRLWGTENLRSRAIARLAEAGFTNDSQSIPIRAFAGVLTESVDTIEHRVIGGFLRLLLAHLQDCADDARANLSALETDAVMLRDFPDEQLSIGQRAGRLQSAIATAERLQHQIRAVRAMRPFSAVSAELPLMRTPVFENVLPYRRIWDRMTRYVDRSSIVVGPDASHRVKPTWRLYEQWVFFQVTAALSVLGLQCESEVGVLQRMSRYRFTLDLDWASRLSFVSPAGDAINVTYQPIIHGQIDAVSRRDTLFRGHGANARRTPDIVIEVLGGERGPGMAPTVVNALIIDAKYSRRIEPRHWDKVHRYFEIRSTASRAAVVRQVWIAYPGESPAITPRDEFISWTSSGPDVAPEENVLGSISLIPHTLEEPEPNDPIGAEPAPILVEFLGAMLGRFGVRKIREARVA